MKDYLERNFKTVFCDLAFIIVGCVCVYFSNAFGDNHRSIPDTVICGAEVIVPIIIIYIFPVKFNDVKVAYKNKKAMIPALISTLMVLIACFVLNVFWGLNNNSINLNASTKICIRLLQAGLTATIFIGCFFKINLKEFGWSISLRLLALIVILYIVSQSDSIFNYLSSNSCNFNNIFNTKLIIYFGLNTIKSIIYPAIFEEVVFRGFLISGLRGFGISDNKCNVIQAVIFGLGHIMSFGMPSLASILARACQAMSGYIMGKLYMKTNSLVPCIILHGLWDAL